MMQWIDVKNKLPPFNHKVLFFCVQEGHLKNIYMGYLTQDGWNIYVPYHSFGLKPDLMPVTYWMELPDYPKVTQSKDCNQHVEMSNASLLLSQ